MKYVKAKSEVVIWIMITGAYWIAMSIRLLYFYYIGS
jgi:hypothetical protein